MMRKTQRIQRYIAAFLVLVITGTIGTKFLFAKSENELLATFENEEVRVEVLGSKDAFPENAVLTFSPLQKQQNLEELTEEERKAAEVRNEQYQQIASHLPEQDFYAYELSIMKDGQRFTPTSELNIELQFKQPVRPQTMQPVGEVELYQLQTNESEMQLVSKHDQSMIHSTSDRAIDHISFSTPTLGTFAVTWAKQKQTRDIIDQKIPFKVLDSKQKELHLGEDFFYPITTGGAIKSKITSLQTTYPILNDYTYYKAYIKQNGAFVSISFIDTSGDALEGPFEYPYSSWDKESDGQAYLYLSFKEKFTEVKTGTVDSTTKGIHMKMIDFYPNYSAHPYSTQAFEGTGYNQEVTQGILEPLLQNGYPVFSDKYNIVNSIDKTSLQGKSMNFLFQQDANHGPSDNEYIGNLKNANHLFLQSIYEQPGHYFYYNSGENAAVFDETTGNFHVYNQLVTPSNLTALFYQRGNFLPYNGVDNPSISINTNQYALDGSELVGERKGETLYLPEGAIKYTFGMELAANFIQDQNGIYDGFPMRYEFTGDDDLWVYVDGVLVLDLGGIHDAREGYIDFSTGEVFVQNSSADLSSTLYDQFQKAGIADQVQWKEITYTDASGNQKTGKIFTDYSVHEMKMWYMERGQGASNLKIKFNLPVIPDNQVWIKKELGEDHLIHGDVSYGFQLYATNDAMQTPDLVHDPAIYQGVIQSADGNHTKALTMDANGIFYLKPGEVAKFDGIVKYEVKEVGISSSDYEKVSINDIVYTHDQLDQELTSNELLAKDYPSVLVRNVPKKENLQSINIRKTMKQGEQTTDAFDFFVQLEGEDGELIPYEGTYTFVDTNGNKRTSTMKQGIVSLHVGEMAEISNILSGTKYSIEEQHHALYGAPQITGIDASMQVKDGVITGVIQSGTSVSLTFENRYAKHGEVNIKKIDQATKTPLSQVEFALYDGDQELATYRTKEDGLITIDLTFLEMQKQYTLKESIPAQGYQEGMVVQNSLVQTLNLSLKEESVDPDGTINVSAVLQGKNGETPLETKEGYQIGNIPTTTIKVEKRWNDQNYVNRPKEIEVQLKQIIQGQASDVPGKTLILKDTDHWQGEFSDLPMWDVDSDQAITYTVTEQTVMKEYVPTLSEENDTIVITNVLQTGNLLIHKQIVDSTLSANHGDPIFTFKIEKDDHSLVYYRTLRLSSGNLEGIVSLEGLPYGNYIVTELDTLRFTCLSPSIQKVTIDEQQKEVQVTYQNKKIKDDQFSHTDVLENHFTIAPDGHVTITPSHLQGNRFSVRNQPMVGQ